jgi:riboflavin kinase/FMN adenylyltransferase
VITSLDPANLSLPERGPNRGPAVVSLGVFDGVHLGHQAILAVNVARARKGKLLPTVVTFREHPKGVILGRAPRTLTTLEHRLELFRRAGIAHTLALRFDAQLRAMAAEDFVREILIERLGVKSFVLGFDSKFGHDRSGGPDLLRRMGFEVEVVPKVVVDQRAVSSSAIREAVELGDLAGAARMLGRRVSVFGTVVRGRELGRRIGFPTANLDLAHELHPPTGVYACLARILDTPASSRASAEARRAVANIGLRPTVEGGDAVEPLVEVHLIDFEGDIYGAHLELEFLQQLRPEERFADLESLRRQIEKDVEAARKITAGVLESTSSV